MDDRSIVVRLDNSATACAAVGWAAWLAERTGRPLVIAATGDSADRPEFAAGTVDHDALLSAGHLSQRRRDHRRSQIKTVVCDQPPTRMVECLSRDAALVVLATDGADRLSDLVFGSAIYHAATGARCPVVLIPPGRDSYEPRSGQRIIVGASGSANGQAALHFATEFAAAVEGSLTVIRGWNVSCSAGEDDAARTQMAEADLLDDLVAEARRLRPDVDVHGHLQAGSGEHVLRTAAAHADLLVVGQHSSPHPHVDGWTSPAARLTRHMTCPVAIVGDSEMTVMHTPLVVGRVRG